MFRSQENEVFEGFWQQDKITGLCVFRQNEDERDDHETPGSVYMGMVEHDRQNGKGIEVWSDGSYYYGNFMNGVKQGHGVYFWADGSKYSGEWSNDEMSG